MTSQVDERISDLIANEKSLSWFGFRVEAARDGNATVTITILPEQANAHGFAHGGVLFALADQALAMAANTLLPFAVTSEAQIQYLVPVRAGNEVVARARTAHHDQRRAVIDVEVSVNGETVALLRGTAKASRQPSI